MWVLYCAQMHSCPDEMPTNKHTNTLVEHSMSFLGRKLPAAGAPVLEMWKNGGGGDK